ncbi:hypothetical protein A3B57_02575 [Microgenomates group bacterium RIFCSPLOWO2_01_FULL_47_10]|nr:MAG: hypothetical protein A3B57_02575 [Microgenomates group bacterium RIFCSPLOWO2_01_FULL_47_10]
MKNIVIGIIISCTLFIGLGWLLVGKEKPTPTFDMQIVAADHQTSASASATLVEYSDFQCPACAAYYELVGKLKADLGDRINIVYRHFPLRSIHKNAQLASQAGQAASLQGKFWEMHDLLFASQTKWAEIEDPTATFISYAAELGLDAAKFTADLTSQPVIDAVNANYSSGLKFGVDSTPSFFLNGTKMTNPGSYEAFKQLVEDKLK